jgi:hypothetical protein
MTRLTLLRSLLLAVLLTGLTPAFAFEVTASVDRTRLSLNESVELTLESSDGTLFGKPDLSPLAPLFEVLATRQLNRLVTVEGEARMVSRWIITLQPRNEGFVVIPPLRLGEAETEAISLHVTKTEQSNGGSLAPIFIDASLDRESVYVQAQTVLTLRIYHSLSLYDDSSLTPLQMTDARVEQLGEPRTYEKLIRGVRHGVIELRYAIFPLHSGDLEIPSQVFSATPVERAAGPFGNFGRPGTPTRVTSPRIPLQVKPKPATYPADAPWLPARSLSLVESWTPDPSEGRVGDSLTRQITLSAEGLSSTQLPPLTETRTEGLRRYPDQPKLDDQVNERGISGSREHREALVPTRAGALQLAAVEVVWWNTEKDHLERASLPQRLLQIASNPDLEAAPEQPLQPVSEQTQGLVWPWQLSTLLLACTTLAGLFLWWRARQQPAVVRSAPTGPSPRSLLDDLKRACLANDPQASRQALDAWARQFPETLAEMAARFTPLSVALDELNGSLYSEAGQHWQGTALWEAIRTLPPTQAQEESTQEASPLPPLYPR